MRYSFVALIASAALLHGCASTMNVGESTFACKEEGGCPTPIEVYKKTHAAPAEILDGKTPKAWKPQGSDVVKLDHAASASERRVQELVAPPRLSVPGERVTVPLRRGSQVARIWIAPWVDGSDRLHWARYVFVEVSPRRWQFGERDVRQESTVPFVNTMQDREAGLPAPFVAPQVAKPITPP